jgi:hypothetical protein
MWIAREGQNSAKISAGTSLEQPAPHSVFDATRTAHVWRARWCGAWRFLAQQSTQYVHRCHQYRRLGRVVSEKIT